MVKLVHILGSGSTSGPGRVRGRDIGGRTICIRIDKHVLNDEFKSRECGTLNLQSDLVKLKFTVKFDPSLLILLFDNASFVSMLKRNYIYCRVYVSST